MATVSRLARFTFSKVRYFYRSPVTYIKNPQITPVTANLLSKENTWIWRKQDSVRFPVNNIQPLILPHDLVWVPPINEPENANDTPKEAPSTENSDNIKQAARLIIIRRKKMKKHKLRKLRKRMKFEWAKRRQRRELKKEKDFQAILIKQCKEAEAFSAEDYVADKIRQLTELSEPQDKNTRISTQTTNSRK